MTVALLWLVPGLVAAAVSARATRHLATTSRMLRRNYRGIEVPAAVGLSIILAILAGAGVLGGLHVLVPSSQRLREASVGGLFFAAAATGFGLLGLWDDLTGGDGERGWRAHLAALGRGRATAGAIKLAGGAALAVVLVAPGGDGLGWTLVGALVVALSANLFNLLDLRPGRAGKVFLVAAAGMLVVGGPVAPALAAGFGAVAAFLPYDLRERAMLGDTGANAIGAIVGLAVVALASHVVEAVTLAVLVALHVGGERPGLSRIIENVPPLRRFDRAGRVPE